MAYSNHWHSAAKNSATSAVLIPGFAAERWPRHHLAPTLNKAGIDVTCVGHSRRRLPVPGLLDTWQSIDVHKACEASVEEFGRSSLYLVTYSRGGKTARNFEDWYVDNRGVTSYELNGVCSVAALGGGKIDLRGITLEPVKLAFQGLRDSRARGMVRDSMGSMMANPWLSAIEGIGCLTYSEPGENALNIPRIDLFLEGDSLVVPSGAQPCSENGNHASPMLEQADMVVDALNALSTRANQLRPVA